MIKEIAAVVLFIGRRLLLIYSYTLFQAGLLPLNRSRHLACVSISVISVLYFGGNLLTNNRGNKDFLG